MMANPKWWIVGFLALAVGLTTGSLPGTAEPPPVQSDAPAASLRPAITYLGVSSCASVACHGGPTSSPTKWQSSYTVWVTKDHHAKAYSVLWEPRSKNIVRLLDGADDPRPWNDSRCLACHSLHRGAADLEIASDGVSCEACHGAASGWLVPHTTVAWKTLPQSKKYAAPFGMGDTKDMIPRAEACIDCHVGQPDCKDGPAREVTHDLIAAGHPRLAFEFSAYMANMPPHWNTAKDTGSNEARAWAVGQALAARAAEEQRAAHAAAGAVDFADFDCYACHHELRGESWRRARAEAHPKESPPGQLRPNTWYTVMLEQLRPLAKLTAKESGEQAAKSLDAWISGQSSAGLSQLMARLAADGSEALQWDDATQCYLALVALNNTRQDRPTSPDQRPSKADKAIHDALEAIQKELAFFQACRQEGSRGTGEADGPPSAKGISRFNSPHDYDPDRFRSRMRQLADRLTGKNE